nr:stage V sporulation protein AD [Maliibacterium massiliense]
MANHRIGKQTVVFEKQPRIASYASIVGPKEGQGPLASTFDQVLQDDTWGEDSFENAERKMFEEAVKTALRKGEIQSGQVDILLGGDLLNQIVSANFAARTLGIPFLGIYGACSTMAESLLVGSMAVDGGFAAHVACVASSHFSSAERQYRFPLEMGTQRTPSAQWTVTGAGCTILAEEGAGPRVTHGTIGKVLDLGVTDANNMGAAMAPAAADTIVQHLRDMNRAPSDYDMIVTGDLGNVGMDLTRELVKAQGIELGGCFNDCGSMIFDAEKQDVHAGGSGCGCSASVLNGHLLGQFASGALKRILFIATGALLSPTTTLQGESIPGIAHAVVIEQGR